MPKKGREYEKQISVKLNTRQADFVNNEVKANASTPSQWVRDLIDKTITEKTRNA